MLKCPQPRNSYFSHFLKILTHLSLKFKVDDIFNLDDTLLKPLLRVEQPGEGDIGRDVFRD